MNSKDAQALKDAIATNLGYLGVESAQRGGMVIQAKGPTELAQVSGFGDTFRVGDVVTRMDSFEAGKIWESTYPERVGAIFAPPGEGLGPSILTRKIDAVDPKISRSGPSSYLVSGVGWTRRFKLLTQADVDAWFTEDKVLRVDGWHKLPDAIGRVLVLDGAPIEIERGSIHQPLARVVAFAEQMLGFDIKPCRTYVNKSKLNMKVKKAVRRSPPRI